MQLCLWNRAMQLQDRSHHYRSFMVVITNSWIVTEYQSAPWERISSTCHSITEVIMNTSGPWELICSQSHYFHSLFRQPRTWILWATWRVFLEKQRMLIFPVHLDHASDLSSSCSFAFVSLYVVFLLSYSLCCMYLFSLSGLNPLIIFFRFRLEPWLPWLIYQIQDAYVQVGWSTISVILKYQIDMYILNELIMFKIL